MYSFKKSILTLLILSLSLPQQSQAEQQVWQNQVRNDATWQQLSTLERDAEFSKFILDVKTGKVYFFDAHIFKMHIDFGLGVLLKQPPTVDNILVFNQNYEKDKPQFILGYLTHYPKLKLWTFSFWEGDAITPQDVTRTYKALNQTFFIPRLTFRPDSLSQEQMAQQLHGINVITNDKIYTNLPFQAFQTGKTTGFLRIIPKDQNINTLNFKTTDIVVLQQAYADISPVAGIITTQFSTPLSHVNLRASAWGIPNAGDKNTAQQYAHLNGQLVTYEVSEQKLELRLANPDETRAFNQKTTHTQTVELPKANLSQKTLLPLAGITAKDVKAYGTKTSNLGEIVSYHNTAINVPDGFGVPFYYYAQHIRHNHLQPMIDAMLRDARFKTDPLWRRTELEKLRLSINQAPMNTTDLATITRQWQTQLGGKGVFVRSSTNAEDLKGFNGAGLYDSVPNVAQANALEPAIKKVWSSIWNERAVNEREFAGIDHQQVYPAVLIQTGVNATAAGVLLTTDIWGHNPNTYTINAKWGLGIRVVEGTNIPEQVLYDTSNEGTRIISRSSDTTMLVFDPINGVKEIPTTQGNTILTEARAKNLGQTVERILPYFSKDTPLDVEWVLEGEKIWIVQARPYVTKARK